MKFKTNFLGEERGYGDPIPQGSHVNHADPHADPVPYHHPYRMGGGIPSSHPPFVSIT